MLNFFIYFVLVFSFTTAKQISGVFTSFDSLIWKKAANYPFPAPQFPSWIATLSWKIKGSNMSAGDTFTLTMPCVFKFTTSQKSINLSVGTTNYATCTFNPGDIVVAFSKLECVLSNSVNPRTDSFGTINFPITFNTGGSALDTDIQDSTCFVNGKNVVTFLDENNKISTSVLFSGGSDEDPEQVVFKSRVIPTLNKQQHFLLAGNCPSGYTSGTLGMQIVSLGATIDCRSIHMAITNSLNDWFMPKNTELKFSHTFVCDPVTFVLTYQNIPKGYRPFIDALVSVILGSKVTVIYLNNYICSNKAGLVNNDRFIEWGPYTNNDAGGNGEAVEIITKTYTGSTTQISTMPFSTSHDRTKTIVVDVPIPTITTTTTYIGISTSFTTSSALPGSTARVVEYDPVYTTTTINTCWSGQTGTFTTTYSTSTWATDIELIVTPCLISSTISLYSSTIQSTSEKEHTSSSEETLSSEESTTSEEVTSEESTASEESSFSEPSSSEEVLTEGISISEELPSSEVSSTEESTTTDDPSSIQEPLSEESTITEEPTVSEETTSENGSSTNEPSSNRPSREESTSTEDISSSEVLSSQPFITSESPTTGEPTNDETTVDEPTSESPTTDEPTENSTSSQPLISSRELSSNVQSSSSYEPLNSENSSSTENQFSSKDVSLSHDTSSNEVRSSSEHLSTTNISTSEVSSTKLSSEQSSYSTNIISFLSASSSMPYYWNSSFSIILTSESGFTGPTPRSGINSESNFPESIISSVIITSKQPEDSSTSGISSLPMSLESASESKVSSNSISSTLDDTVSSITEISSKSDNLSFTSLFSTHSIKSNPVSSSASSNYFSSPEITSASMRSLLSNLSISSSGVDRRTNSLIQQSISEYLSQSENSIVSSLDLTSSNPSEIRSTRTLFSSSIPTTSFSSFTFGASNSTIGSVLILSTASKSSSFTSNIQSQLDDWIASEDFLYSKSVDSNDNRLNTNNASIGDKPTDISITNISFNPSDSGNVSNVNLGVSSSLPNNDTAKVPASLTVVQNQTSPLKAALPSKETSLIISHNHSTTTHEQTPNGATRWSIPISMLILLTCLL